MVRGNLFSIANQIELRQSLKSVAPSLLERYIRRPPTSMCIPTRAPLRTYESACGLSL